MNELNFDCIIGIDPGANGGIATWRPNQNVKTIRMPKDLQELREYLQYIKSISKSPIIFLEKVQLMARLMAGICCLTAQCLVIQV